ncbi:hypothetical protein BD769DRAFT_1684840 [Suillus cothurnatus]|nr:hypothetical protein BD769DRAFT_1684840 [Suillus cothurnatus]
MAISSLHSSSAPRLAASHKSSLSKCVDAEMQDVQGQVKSLTDVNANQHQLDIEFQREQAEKEHDEAAIVHQRAQEAKALELQLLEAQAKVQSEKQAALQLEIKLLKLKGLASG